MSASTTLPEFATIEDKAREFCEFVVQDPGFAAARGKIDLFMENEEAKSAYRAWQEKGQQLHQMSHQGAQPSDEDVAEIEMLKATVMANPVAVDFAEAEDHMNSIFGSMVKILQKTLQNGEVPTAEELAENECCGNSGCGCD